MGLQKVDIGKREIVGFGQNGEITYFDSVMHPFPAIRFKEDAGDITALREKEKGDWKKMTVEEKKALYRASFCQTLAEVEAPTGEWKSIIGIALIGLSLGLWGFLFLAVYAYEPVSDSVTNPERVRLSLTGWLLSEWIRSMGLPQTMTTRRDNGRNKMV